MNTWKGIETAHVLHFGRTLVSALSAVILCLPVVLVPVAFSHAVTFGTRTPVKHVIIITMENHSFDNIFGNYPLGGTSPFSNLTSQLSVPVNLIGSNLSGSLTPVPPGTYSTANPIEGYSAYHLDWNHGRMNGFAANSGKQSMTYFTASQMAIEWVLAEEYAIGDMYFASALTATMPNRVFGIAGYSPVLNDYGPPPYIPFSQSIFSELNSYGVSWSYYVANPSLGTIILDYFYGVHSYASDIRSWSSFFSELQSGTLPAVSYFMPIGLGVSGYSQHPSDSMLAGELWLLYTVGKIMHSPEWNSTAIFINYDEGGGYYDNVPPPSVGGQQLGFRVPLILISPYAKENYISSTPMNHASLLAFIDYNWGMPALNAFVSQSDLPVDMFTFGIPGARARPPFNLNFSGIAMPSSISFPLSSVGASPISDIFPAPPQIPLGNLNYSRTGSSAVNLAQMHAGLYVSANYPYTPYYESIEFIGAFMIVLSALAVVVLYRIPGRRH